jgi:hypothetical protein
VEISAEISGAVSEILLEFNSVHGCQEEGMNNVGKRRKQKSKEGDRTKELQHAKKYPEERRFERLECQNTF